MSEIDLSGAMNKFIDHYWRGGCVTYTHDDSELYNLKSN